jgi:hypothetical protein
MPISLKDLVPTTPKVMTLEANCHMFIKLLRFYTKSPIISKECDILQNRVESTIVYFLGISPHYVKHPDHYLHRFKYCLRCGSTHRLNSSASWNPSLLTTYCCDCSILEGQKRSGRGYREYIDCYNPMVAVYDALPLEYRQTIDSILDTESTKLLEDYLEIVLDK